jgi:hypothetical protein
MPFDTLKRQPTNNVETRRTCIRSYRPNLPCGEVDAQRREGVARA